MSAAAPANRRSGTGGWLASPPPSAAVEIAADRVTGLVVADQGGGVAVSAYAAEPLGAGILEPALNAGNVHDAAALAAAVGTVFEKLGSRPRRIALVVPDTAVKVSLVRFEKVPVRAQDLDQLIRWQVRKAAPYRIEDAQVSWVPGVGLPGGGREFIVTTARRDVIESYERACQAAGATVGLVDIASFNLINAVLAAGGAGAAGDWMLVHVTAEYATIAVVRGADLVFFRNRGGGDLSDLSDLVHQTAMYHEDRLGGGGFTRVVIAGAASRGAERADWLRRSVEERLGLRVEPLDLRAVAPMRDRIHLSADVMDAIAPALGVLLRERVA